MPEKIDLLLVNVGGTRKRVYQELSKDFSGIEPPSWAALTAGFIRKLGFNVKILDANAENLSAKEAAEFIVKQYPKLVGIPVYGQQANTSTPTMIGVRELCNEIKNEDVNTKVILTGWHPSVLPERTLKEENCDFVGEGEGFYTYLRLLEGKKLEDVPGLWYKKNGNIFSNPRAENISDLTSELSEIAWDLLPMNKYRSFNWHSLADLESRNKYASLFTSLGCPFRCNFCAIHGIFEERRMRFWNPEWVLKQIDFLVENYGIKNIKINDELFIFNPNHFMPIVEGLIKRDYGLNIAAFARVDATKKEYLSKLKKAGFNWLELGIESGNDEVLRRASKGKYNKEIIKEVVKNIHDAGIDLCANFIFGLPGDTLESMQETLDLAFELKTAFPSFFCAMAPPGSDLYDESLKKGVPLPESWIGYAQQSYDFFPLPNENLSAEQIVRFRDNAFNAYFRNPDYLIMIEKKFGEKARKHVEEMASHNLKRKLLGD